MIHMEPDTKRQMARAAGLSIAFFALPASMAYRYSVRVATLTLLGMPLLIALLPLTGLWSRQRQSNYKEERERWRETYKASPESHLLRLND